ncbi:hypothetical protein NESM_000892200 [Novymonas esmeraldas]|uniref:Uncharacterized protein n=1 Tax=Novymonas esmeraldas TaxID=1808958 RepID=A0AAW0F0U5_9TRYP
MQELPNEAGHDGVTQQRRHVVVAVRERSVEAAQQRRRVVRDVACVGPERQTVEGEQPRLHRRRQRGERADESAVVQRQVREAEEDDGRRMCLQKGSNRLHVAIHDAEHAVDAPRPESRIECRSRVDGGHDGVLRVERSGGSEQHIGDRMRLLARVAVQEHRHGLAGRGQTLHRRESRVEDVELLLQRRHQEQHVLLLAAQRRPGVDRRQHEQVRADVECTRQWPCDDVQHPVAQLSVEVTLRRRSRHVHVGEVPRVQRNVQPAEHRRHDTAHTLGSQHQRRRVLEPQEHHIQRPLKRHRARVAVHQRVRKHCLRDQRPLRVIKTREECGVPALVAPTHSATEHGRVAAVAAVVAEHVVAADDVAVLLEQPGSVRAAAPGPHRLVERVQQQPAGDPALQHQLSQVRVHAQELRRRGLLGGRGDRR